MASVWLRQHKARHEESLAAPIEVSLYNVGDALNDGFSVSNDSRNHATVSSGLGASLAARYSVVR